MSALAAPRIAAGFVLSQPVSSTTPSSGYARMDSSTSIAIRLRYSIVVGFISDSPRDITGNSTGNPPACSTPRLTDSASPRRWMLQFTSSDHELQIPITGRPRNVSSVTPVDLSQDRCRKPSRSLRSNHSSLRRPPFRPPKLAPLRIVAMSLLRLRLRGPRQPVLGGDDRRQFLDRGLVGRLVEHDAAVPEQVHAVAHLEHVHVVVRDHDDRHVAALLQLRDQLGG